jgi:hypothetical protein
MQPEQNKSLVSLPRAMPGWRYPVLLGLVLGTGFGLWNWIASQWDPLAEDTPVALLMFYGPMFASWGLVGFGASRRTGRLRDGVKVGAAVAFVT